MGSIIIHDHYWRCSDGRVYSSARMAYIDPQDADYQEWLSAGNLPNPFCKDTNQQESEDAMREMLASYGRVMFESDITPAEQRGKAYVSETDPLLNEVLGYGEEAKALREAGDDPGAAQAEEWARNKRAEWLELRRAIREQYPDAL